MVKKKANRLKTTIQQGLENDKYFTNKHAGEIDITAGPLTTQTYLSTFIYLIP